MESPDPRGVKIPREALSLSGVGSDETGGLLLGRDVPLRVA